MYLSRLRLQSIRAFDELELAFIAENGRPRSWTLLLGDNATGKTTLLRSIAIGLNDQSSAAGLVRELKGSLVRQGADEGYIFCELVDRKRKWTTKTTIQPIPRTGDLVTQEVSEGSLDDFLSKHEPDSDQPDKQRLEGFKKFPWKRLFVVGYGAGRTTEGRDEFDEYRTVDAVYTLFRYDQPLQSPELGWRRARDRAEKQGDILQRDKVDDQIRAILRQVLMLESPDNIELTESHIVVTRHSRSTSLSVSADGYKATATWILDLVAWHLLFSPRASGYLPQGIVLLDEIEQHLHPRWQRYLVKRMKEAFPKVQFIGTTHSALCAAGAADLKEAEGALIRTSFDKNTSSIVKEEIPLPRGLKADQILTSEAFGLSDTRNPQLGEKVEEYRKLVQKEGRTDKEKERLRQLRRKLRQTIPSSAQFEDERKLRDELRKLVDELRRMRKD